MMRAISIKFFPTRFLAKFLRQSKECDIENIPLKCWYQNAWWTFTTYQQKQRTTLQAWRMWRNFYFRKASAAGVMQNEQGSAAEEQATTPIEPPNMHHGSYMVSIAHSVDMKSWSLQASWKSVELYYFLPLQKESAALPCEYSSHTGTSKNVWRWWKSVCFILMEAANQTIKFLSHPARAVNQMSSGTHLGFYHKKKHILTDYG